MRMQWVLGLALVAGPGVAATIHIDQASGNDAHDGSTPANAVATITRGLQLVAASDTLDIGPGTYGAASGEVLPLVVPGAQTIRGAGAARTILDGAHASTVMQVQASGAAVVLRDLAVVRGGLSGGGGIGGGVQFNEDTLVLIERCRFEDNDAGIGGALAFLYNTSATADVLIRDSSFLGNVASIGGAIQFQLNASGNHRLQIRHVLFDANGGIGAAIQFQQNAGGTHTIVVDRSIFARSDGDALSLAPGAGILAATVSSSLFAYNIGNAIDASGAPVHVVNATVVGNSSGVVGGAGTRVDNSILWFNGAEVVGSGGSVANSIVQGHDLDGHVDAGGVSGADPQLRGNWRPSAGSPAIDRGAHAPVAALGLMLDLAGEPRETDVLHLGLPTGFVDMGAFEATPDVIFDDGFEAPPLPPT